MIEDTVKQRLLWTLGALIVASLLLTMAFHLMPKRAAPKALTVTSASWIVKGDTTEQAYPVKLGFTIHSQIPAGTSCCSGTYNLEVTRDQLAALSSPDEMLAVYFPAIGGDFRVSLNDKQVPIPHRKDYSSIGPLIPVDHKMLADGLRLNIQIDGPQNPYLGIWKGPALVGSYFQLFDWMDNERDYQVNLPLLNAFALLLFGALFFVLYLVSNRQAPFFLQIFLAFCLYALFDLFLSGAVRHNHIYIGYVLHYPARILMSLGTYLLVANFVDTITEEQKFSTGKRLIITSGILGLLALVNLIFGLKDSYVAIVWIVAVSFIIPFWPLARAALYKKEDYWLSLITLAVLMFSLFGSLADASKLVSRLFQVRLPYDYFTRYNTAVLIGATIVISSVYFKRFFVTLQKERIGRLKAQGISRAIKMLAHDIRRPFSTVQLGLRVLNQTSINDQTAFIEKMRAQVNKHIESVNITLQDVMDFGGETQLRRETTDLCELIRGTTDEASNLYAQSRVAIDLDIPARLDINIDRHKIIRVLSNIIHNAYEAIRERDGIITVRVTQDDNICSIDIHNSNSYIPREKVRSIFEDFYTADKPGGTGLGLAVAKEFVEAHLGRISCVSDVTSGTCFQIKLPRH